MAEKKRRRPVAKPCPKCGGMHKPEVCNFDPLRTKVRNAPRRSVTPPVEDLVEDEMDKGSEEPDEYEDCIFPYD